MILALLLHLIAIPTLALQLLMAVPAEGWRHCWKRLPLFILIWMVFSTLILFHVIGHLLDEILFFGYRKTPIKEPVFILGIPRSGTTFLQRLLGKDTSFTTFTTWEALLAPSISEKFFFLLLGKLLRPLETLVLGMRKKIFRDMDAIHQIRLQEPEEDFLLLLPLRACLLLVFLCPGSKHFWQLGNFDNDIPAYLRRIILSFYTLCLKKHLYFHKQRHQDIKNGATDDCKRLLSKNPSFTSWTESILDAFPDARLVACIRPPAEVVPSQLSSLRPVMDLLGNGKLSDSTQMKMIELLHGYYKKIGRHQQDKQFFMLHMQSLRTSPESTLRELITYLGLDTLDLFSEEISKAKKYNSGHQYNLDEFSLTEQLIQERFDDTWPIQPNPLIQD